MEKNPLENPRPDNRPIGNQEKLYFSIRIATPDDWQTCKDLRIESLTGPDRDMMAVTPQLLKETLEKSEQDWRKETQSEEMFSVLSFQGEKAVGLGRTLQKEKGIWWIRNGYVKPESRNHGLQKRMIALRLKEIINRGGVKAIAGIKQDHEVSLNNAEKFGFKLEKVYKGEAGGLWNIVSLDVTDPEVFRKINQILNAE